MTEAAIIHAGQDRAFRMFSTIQDQQSSELSQGHIARRAKRLKVDQQELKLPRVTALDASQVRSLETEMEMVMSQGQPWWGGPAEKEKVWHKWMSAA